MHKAKVVFCHSLASQCRRSALRTFLFARQGYSVLYGPIPLLSRSFSSKNTRQVHRTMQAFSKTGPNSPIPGYLITSVDDLARSIYSCSKMEGLVTTLQQVVLEGRALSPVALSVTLEKLVDWTINSSTKQKIFQGDEALVDFNAEDVAGIVNTMPRYDVIQSREYHSVIFPLLLNSAKKASFRLSFNEYNRCIR